MFSFSIDTRMTLMAVCSQGLILTCQILILWPLFHFHLSSSGWKFCFYNLSMMTFTQKNYSWKIPSGFPGGAVVENLPANAGDTGSSPGLGRSHMPRSNWAHEPQLLSLRVWSLCSATREAAIVRGPRTAMKSGPRSPQLEKALAQKRRPNTAKKINK